MSNPQVVLHIKEYGDIKLELYPDKAPETVANFVKLVGEGFYSGLIFHRVIRGFMIQGGGYTASFEDRETGAIKGEFKANGFMENPLRHTRGVLSMARTSDPDSASSQFFVMHADAPHLDGQYAGFGKLVDGFDVLDKIATTRTGSIGFYMQDVPRETIEIETIEVLSE